MISGDKADVPATASGSIDEGAAGECAESDPPAIAGPVEGPCDAAGVAGEADAASLENGEGIPEQRTDRDGDANDRDSPSPPYPARENPAPPDVLSSTADTAPKDIAVVARELGELRLVGASVIGPGHRKTGKPRQDALECGIDSDRGRGIAVLCDGAGSAPRAEIGAAITARTVRDTLLAESAAIPAKSGPLVEGAWREAAERGVELARAALAERAGHDGEADIAAYHATLVAAVIDPDGGVIVNLGDGFAAAVAASDSNSAPMEADWEAPTCALVAENGNSDSETFFVTVADWRKRLRVAATGAVQRLALITDGPDAFALNKTQDGLSGALWCAIDAHLTDADAPAGARALAGTLDSRDAQRVSRDDKTVIWINRGR